MPMTDRQEHFVECYLRGPRGIRFNATRSAEAAGYAWPAKQGTRLLTFPTVDHAVKARFRVMLSKTRRGVKCYLL